VEGKRVAGPPSKPAWDFLGAGLEARTLPLPLSTSRRPGDLLSFFLGGRRYDRKSSIVGNGAIQEQGNNVASRRAMY